MIFATLLTLFIQNITRVKWGPWGEGLNAKPEVSQEKERGVEGAYGK